MVTGNDLFRAPLLVAPWVAFIAALMISNVATYSWGSIRLRRTIRLEAILLLALVGTALFAEPLWTLIVVCIGYIALIPFSMRSYARVKQRRAAETSASA